jgi:hypothetical protein
MKQKSMEFGEGPEYSILDESLKKYQALDENSNKTETIALLDDGIVGWKSQVQKWHRKKGMNLSKQERTEEEAKWDSRMELMTKEDL